MTTEMELQYFCLLSGVRNPTSFEVCEIDGWMDEWIDEWMDEWMDKWIDGWIA